MLAVLSVTILTFRVLRLLQRQLIRPMQSHVRVFASERRGFLLNSPTPPRQRTTKASDEGTGAGSHLDTLPSGGRFDGVVGVIAEADLMAVEVPE